MHYSIFSALLLCATSTVILFGATANAEFHCQPDEWWNASGICVTCTRCPELVLRTCQPHKDTVCGGFEDIEINLIQVRETNKIILINFDYKEFITYKYLGFS